jgi:hypothetical protein
MDPSLTPNEARDIAADAFINGYPMLENYRMMIRQAIDGDDPAFIGGFGVLKNDAIPCTPEDGDVVMPNNDTRPSVAWLDLRAEPFVMSVPAVSQDRYYAMQWIDLDGAMIGDIGVRTTGFEAGSYLIAGPDWRGRAPDGITETLQARSPFVRLDGQTLLEGPDDVPALEAIQGQYRLEELSQFQAMVPPPPAPEIAWISWDDDALTTHAFIPYLSFLLQFGQPPELAGREAARRLARIGIGPDVPFDESALSSPLREAINAGVADAIARISDRIADATAAHPFFCAYESLGDDPIGRAAAARYDVYDNAVAEVWCGGWETDADGNLLDGARCYRLRFDADALPPARFFWSATMYGLPGWSLVANPIGRLAIGSRTRGLLLDDDGGLTLEIGSRPPDPERLANWLPAPAGPFSIVLRIYGPLPEIFDGPWQLPPLREVACRQPGADDADTVGASPREESR